MKDQPCFMSRVFPIPKGAGGHRLVMDLSELNKFIFCPKFKMSNHDTLRKWLNFPSWLTCIDIKDAYLHIPIRENLHKFLEIPCNSKLFFFHALPFGLAPAPWLFAAIMKYSLAVLRTAGVKLMVYLDDIILWAESPTVSSGVKENVKTNLESPNFFGFQNQPKEIFARAEAVTSIARHLWDSRRGLCRTLPILQIEIAQTAQKMLHKKMCLRKELEVLIGKIAFAAQCSRRAKLLAHDIAKSQLLKGKNRDEIVKFPRR